MAGTVVVDASLAVALVVDEDQSDACHAMLVHWEQGTVQRLAPALFALETATALRVYARRGRITTQGGRTRLQTLLNAVIIRPSDADLVWRAYELATLLDQGAVYDCTYAAMAEAEGCELWTADERFFNATRRRLPWVHWVGEARR